MARRHDRNLGAFFNRYGTLEPGTTGPLSDDVQVVAIADDARDVTPPLRVSRWSVYGEQPAAAGQRGGLEVKCSTRLRGLIVEKFWFPGATSGDIFTWIATPPQVPTWLPTASSALEPMDYDNDRRSFCGADQTVRRGTTTTTPAVSLPRIEAQETYDFAPGGTGRGGMYLPPGHIFAVVKFTTNSISRIGMTCYEIPDPFGPLSSV